MPTLIINGVAREVVPGLLLIDVLREAGIDVPTLCEVAHLSPWTACMVCVVHDRGADALVPSCTARISGDMMIDTDTEVVRDARRTAVELLLSEHVGDCVAPCSRACPEHLDIPRLMRMAAAGELLPSELTACMDCAARCERACRRRRVDAAVAISAVLKAAPRVKKRALADTAVPRMSASSFNSTMGHIHKDEIPDLMNAAAQRARVIRSTDDGALEYTREEVILEAERCMHCDCRAARDCRLRAVASRYEARQTRFRSSGRPRFASDGGGDRIVFESGKCLRCGACLRIAEAADEPLGLAFVERGAAMRVSVPFEAPVAEGLSHSADACVAACPTGALSFR